MNGIWRQRLDMPSYRSPGVYVGEISHGSKAIGRHDVSITAFVGQAARGPIGKSEQVDGVAEYGRLYGPVASDSDSMGLAVSAYFANGGSVARIFRVGSDAPSEYERFFAEDVRQACRAGIVVLPGQFWPVGGSGNPIIASAIAHCEATRSGMVIVDPPPGRELNAAVVEDMALPVSSYAAMYYPWLAANHPEGRTPGRKRAVWVAPSAYAAGVWAKTDANEGVWKSPAGEDAGVEGITGLQFEIKDSDQEQLNPLGINCLRNLPGKGPVLWSARTLASRTNPEWLYVSVRRLVIFIEQSIYNSTEWVVFEPNDETTWSTLRREIDAFMMVLWRQGALLGSKPSDAYFVNCGLGVTMTQADIDAGRIIMGVGFSPLKSAEFIVLRIQQIIS